MEGLISVLATVFPIIFRKAEIGLNLYNTHSAMKIDNNKGRIGSSFQIIRAIAIIKGNIENKR